VVVKATTIRTDEEMFQWMEERERVDDLIRAWRNIQMDILIDLD
jgi:hypothetical protein